MKNVRQTKGFTLIEIMIVVVVIGILASIVAPIVTRAFTGNTNALAFKTVAESMNKSYTMLITEAGTGIATTGSALLGNASNTVLDILVNGDNPTGLVASGYATAYKRSGIKPMIGTITVVTAPTVGVAGAYEISDHTLTYSVAADGTASVSFDDVVTGEIETLFEKYSAGTFDGTVANTSGPIQWTAPSAAGTHTLTIESQI